MPSVHPEMGAQVVAAALYPVCDAATAVLSYDARRPHKMRLIMCREFTSLTLPPLAFGLCLRISLRQIRP